MSRLSSIIALCVLTIACCVQTESLAPNKINPEVNNVKKRSYDPWSLNNGNSLSLYNVGNFFKPSTHSLTRPYYIPVYGQPGKWIFYPPQPIYNNPGSPPDNQQRPRPYQGPSYLPPKTTTTEKMDLGNRFGENGDFNGLPVWGVVSSDAQPKEWTIVPTRPPVPAAGFGTLPPLVRPTAAAFAAQSPRKEAAEENVAAESGPSNCVWAIISCCSVARPDQPSQNCFEQRGCPGPFWDNSPCDSGYTRTAIQAALNYYNSNPGAASPLGK